MTIRNGEPGGNVISGLTRPDFAVIGTGRCGTRYMAHVLHACGLECGHENWWTLRSVRRRSGLDGDSSWLALSSIESGEWSGPVVHVTRHPLGVVRSLVGLEHFSRVGAFGAFSLAHEPDLARMSELEACVAWWVRWNDRCAKVADLTLRVEDVLEKLDHIGGVVGHDLDAGKAASVPETVNHRRHWQAEPPDEEKVWDLLGDAPARFGYQPCG